MELQSAASYANHISQHGRPPQKKRGRPWSSEEARTLAQAQWAQVPTPEARRIRTLKARIEAAGEGHDQDERARCAS
jgi:hypothetical protein